MDAPPAKVTSGCVLLDQGPTDDDGELCGSAAWRRGERSQDLQDQVRGGRGRRIRGRNEDEGMREAAKVEPVGMEDGWTCPNDRGGAWWEGSEAERADRCVGRWCRCSQCHTAAAGEGHKQVRPTRRPTQPPGKNRGRKRTNPNQGKRDRVLTSPFLATGTEPCRALRTSVRNHARILLFQGQHGESGGVG